MDDPELEVALDHLFSSPPEEFVAGRDALVRTLKSAKRTEDAATVKSWRRPSRAVWALNQASLAGDDAISDLIDAARVVGELSSSGGPGLREAMTELRSQTRRAIDAAVSAIASARPNDHSEISAALLSVLSDADALALLAQGRLLEIPDAGLTAFGSIAPEAAGPRRSTPARTSRSTNSGRVSADERAQREEQQRALRDRRQDVKDAEARQRAAQTALDAAQDEQQRCVERLDEARQAVVDAEAAVKTATGATETARTAATTAADALEEARQSLAALDADYN